MHTNYQDFELEISSNGPSAYCVKVLKSPVGETERHPLNFRFGDQDGLKRLRDNLEKAVLNADEAGHGPAGRSEVVLRDFGREIFRSVFVNAAPVQNLYAQSKGKSKDLRIKLRIESTELAALPWEYLYEDNELPSFVSLRVPVVRYVQTPGPPNLMEIKGPLRILGMVANPATADWPKLNVAKERDRINKGIDRLQREKRVVFEWVTGETGKDLMNKLLEDEWHVFHFIGHGGVEPRPSADGNENGSSFDESGYIVMVDEDGKPAKKFASDLATMLMNASRSLRLVVLNCCESARINVGEKYGNPAIGLMRTGWLPAAVAMQFPISDKAAIGLSEGFYRALATNRPVDDAVTFARRLIQQESRVEWGIPVLYIRSPDGKLFDLVNPAIHIAGENGKGPEVSSGEHLQEKRGEWMRLDRGPNSISDLEQLTRSGRELATHFPDDRELATRLARAYFDLGNLQQRQNDISKAAASFASAIELDPRNADYRVRRANLNARVGFYENALADIGEAIRLQSEQSEFYWIKGIICGIAAGPDNNPAFVEEAIKAFSLAIAKNPQESKYHVSRANAFAQVKQFSEAVRDMDRAISLAPDNTDLMAQRTRIAREMV